MFIGEFITFSVCCRHFKSTIKLRVVAEGINSILGAVVVEVHGLPFPMDFFRPRAITRYFIILVIVIVVNYVVVVVIVIVIVVVVSIVVIVIVNYFVVVVIVIVSVAAVPIGYFRLTSSNSSAIDAAVICKM